jgi:dTDP-4-dehydrorhamnose 3,5-epimerase
VEGVEDLSFSPARVDGAFEIEGTNRADDRGHFARVWCARLFSGRGLAESFAQVNTGVSGKAGTLRGMHYQLAPHAEVKLARCVRGAVFDVAVDLRPASPTYRRWHGCELSAANGRMLYVPEGCAHGYLTLTDDAELMYFTTAAYAPQSARGVRHDDPAFGIAWPAAVNVISPQDAAWPDFRMEPT